MTSLRSYRVSAAVGSGKEAPTPTDVRAMVSSGVTIVGTEAGLKTRNPRRLKDSINAAAAAVSATEETHPKVLCLRSPGLVEKIVAWDHDVQLAVPHTILLGGQLPAKLKAGEQIVLDERGRTPAQVEEDLAALASFVSGSYLPQEPMRALWRQA